MDGPTKSKRALHPFEKKSSSSKYDFVKVRVWLGDHFFVLSRYLVSRILMVTKIPYDDAIKMTLELKKRLVDTGRLDVRYSDMENQLFDILREHLYGQEYISRFRMMNMFHNERVPLVILLGGTDCIGKSTLARLLAEQLNLPFVIHTDIVFDLMRTLVGSFAGTPLARRLPLHSNFENTDELVKEYRRECALVRMGLESDLQKCVREGKSMIVEGFHLDPSFYDQLLRGNSSGRTSEHAVKATEKTNLQIGEDMMIARKVVEDGLGETPYPAVQHLTSAPSHEPTPSSGSPMNHVARERLITQTPIVIHFTLTLAEVQHRHCTENWADAALERDSECLSSLDTDSHVADPNMLRDQRQSKLLANLRAVQRYLEGPVSAVASVVPVNTHHLGETLGVLHDAVLRRITEYFAQSSADNRVESAAPTTTNMLSEKALQLGP